MSEATVPGPDKRGRYPYGCDGVPIGYVLCQFPDGMFWVSNEPKWQTPLTVERLVDALREVIASERGSIGNHNMLRQIISALDSEEE